jgi:hypothetical protein
MRAHGHTRSQSVDLCILETAKRASAAAARTRESISRSCGSDEIFSQDTNRNQDPVVEEVKSVTARWLRNVKADSEGGDVNAKGGATDRHGFNHDGVKADHDDHGSRVIGRPIDTTSAPTRRTASDDSTSRTSNSASGDSYHGNAAAVVGGSGSTVATGAQRSAVFQRRYSAVAPTSTRASLTLVSSTSASAPSSDVVVGATASTAASPHDAAPRKPSAPPPVKKPTRARAGSVYGAAAGGPACVVCTKTAYSMERVEADGKTYVRTANDALKKAPNFLLLNRVSDVLKSAFTWFHSQFSNMRKRIQNSLLSSCAQQFKNLQCDCAIEHFETVRDLMPFHTLCKPNTPLAHRCAHVFGNRQYPRASLSPTHASQTCDFTIKQSSL